MAELDLFTSESVSEGHPDKLADQISDGILDELLKQDTQSRVALETLLTRGLAVVAGELTTRAYVEIADVVRNTICDVGYVHTDYGFDGYTTGVMLAIGNPKSVPMTTWRFSLSRRTSPRASIGPTRMSRVRATRG